MTLSSPSTKGFIWLNIALHIAANAYACLSQGKETETVASVLSSFNSTVTLGMVYLAFADVHIEVDEMAKRLVKPFKMALAECNLDILGASWNDYL